jgi:hypothetical protein
MKDFGCGVVKWFSSKRMNALRPEIENLSFVQVANFSLTR